MFRAAIRYAILAFLLISAYGVRLTNSWQFSRILLNPEAFPEAPFSLQMATRTIGSGPLFGNQILALDGKPFNSYGKFDEAWNTKNPGDTLLFTLSAPDGHAFETTVTIPSQASDNASIGKRILAACTDIFIPLLALTLGAVVVLLRPSDRNAWLLLLLMIAFSEMMGIHVGNRSAAEFAWAQYWIGQWPLFMMLFGISFPERSRFDERRPWLKYLFIIPCAVPTLAMSVITVIWFNSINRALPWRPLIMRLYGVQLIAGMLAISSFFANLGAKAGMAKSGDNRRRLRILLFGSAVSLTPMFGVVVYAALRDRDIFVGLPWAVILVAFAFLSLFPITLGYVIVVERAMDLRFVIRQGVRYGFAKVGLWLARAVLVMVAIYMFRRAETGSQGAPANALGFVTAGVGLLAFRRRTADGASRWIDRKFFREAYNAEHILTDLASEAGRYFEIAPLLDKVSQRISGTLHVPDIVVLIREGEYFIPRYSTRAGEPMSVPVDSRIAQALRDKEAALVVYFDQPSAWIHTLNAEELQTLDVMRTQLLLPIFGNGQLAGMLSLGPKLSEIPYSATDIRLLQAVASQMALALENARLAASLAAEAGYRERANRELEIAREVQERLFPQNFPPIPGLDCAGYCRPARGVGGDYYDFLQLEDGRLGIAIGDVSGKGIAAALLMASLQASLRGQTLAGLHDLSALMSNVNRLVYEASTSNRYATFFYGEYNVDSRQLTFVNAGHNPPVILRGNQVVRLEAGGPVVGLLPGVNFASDEAVLLPGDIFIAFTDGISEALNEQEEEWEEERFISAAQSCSSLSAKQMIDSVFRAADAFTGSAKQYDDMTLLIMKLV